jgi:hypothetical protein
VYCVFLHRLECRPHGAGGQPRGPPARVGCTGLLGRRLSLLAQKPHTRVDCGQVVVEHPAVPDRGVVVCFLLGVVVTNAEGIELRSARAFRYFRIMAPPPPPPVGRLAYSNAAPPSSTHRAMHPALGRVLTGSTAVLGRRRAGVC